MSALSANQIPRDQSDRMTSPIRQGDSKVARDFRKNIEKQMKLTESPSGEIADAGKPNSQNVMEEIEDSSEGANPELQSRLNPSVDQLTRRLAMQGFLKKMEEDVGVDAGQIVAAFSQLSANDLVAPPEASVEKIVDQLGLESSERGRALELFQNLLKQTSPSNVGEYLNGNDRQVSLEVISADEARKKALSASLDRMSQAFFVDNQIVRQDKETKNDETIGPMGGKKGVVSEFDSRNSSSTGMSPSNGILSVAESGQIIPQGFTSDLGAELSTSRNTASGARPRGFETFVGDNRSIEATASESDMLNSEVKASGQSDQGANAAHLSEAEIPAIRSEVSAFSQNTEADQTMAFPVNLSGLAQEESQDKSFESQDLDGVLNQAETRFTGPEWGTRKSEKNDLSAHSISQSRAENQREGKREFQGEQQLSDQLSDQISGLANTPKHEGAKGNQFLIQMPKMTSAQESSNVRDVVDQAQVLVKNGGGEMKIKLNPEGVGEVTLKVMSDGGRINIEMIASNANTKKLLENGLADLRETFSSHRINVDQIKIGSPDNISKHMDQNMQDQNQSHVRQFLEEFRQNNQNWRQGFVDMPAMKNYRSQAQDDSVDQSIPSMRSKPRNGSRRLDLVA
ncbi:MAG: flagellar hook-length control protein FliK [Bdellovibrionales bacterium]|nr:flagellar hook-length control protein FliK [Bdellovibrionales bacterium]